ncbi:MAG: type VI secretion system baseplate subunit TssF [Burkholderiaceae bacterium]|nr:MAG: type VI secretion system baseplate subunit TssF [Burkholderiaceae bacterium]
MDPRIIELYNEELLHLRTEAAEFAREYPDRAARLALDDKRVEDPYVERLLEGVAYLAARVRLKLEAQYPLFTQQLVEVLFPGWLAPTPSCAVLRFEPDPADADLANGVVLPRGTGVRGSLRGSSDIRCDFQTGRALQLLPLRLADAQYIAARPEAVPELRLAERPASSLRIELELMGDADLSTLPMDALPLFVTSSDAWGSQLMELLGGRCVGVGLSTEPAMRSVKRWLPASQVRHMGFEEDEALLRNPVRGHTGFRILKEYAALPDKFRFVELSGLRQALAGFRGRKLYLHLLFSGSFNKLESAVKAESLALFCVPAVNLRERQLDRVDLEPGMTEFPLYGDRMRPKDYEIIEVLDVVGGGAGTERRFSPLHETISGGKLSQQSHYTLRRQRRLLTQSESAGRSVTYPGTDVFMALSEPASPPYGKDLRYVSVRALCSNRDMPLFLRAQFSEARYDPLDALPVSRIECLAGPSLPLSSPVDGFDPWMALSHLFVNHLSLFDGHQQGGAAALRAMLGLYATVPGHFLGRQSEGLLNVAAHPITRRIPGGGPLAFGRGVAVKLSMSDRAFDGGSPFLLAAVLENYLAAHVSINSFVETHVEMIDRAEQLKWPTRFGRRPTF